MKLMIHIVLFVAVLFLMVITGIAYAKEYEISYTFELVDEDNVDEVRLLCKLSTETDFKRINILNAPFVKKEFLFKQELSGADVLECTSYAKNSAGASERTPVITASVPVVKPNTPTGTTLTIKVP